MMYTYQIAALIKVHFEQDPEAKKEKQKEFWEVTLVKFFKRLEKQLEANGGKYLAGSEVSVWSNFGIIMKFTISVTIYLPVDLGRPGCS